MLSIDEAKARAGALGTILKQFGYAVSPTQCQEAVARLEGARDWAAFLATAPRSPVEGPGSAPLYRVALKAAGGEGHGVTALFREPSELIAFMERHEIPASSSRIRLQVSAGALQLSVHGVAATPYHAVIGAAQAHTDEHVLLLLAPEELEDLAKTMGRALAVYYKREVQINEPVYVYSIFADGTRKDWFCVDGRRACYLVPPLPAADGGDYYPEIVLEDEPLRRLTDWNWGKDLGQAQQACATLNAEHRVTPDAVAAILKSSPEVSAT